MEGSATTHDMNLASRKAEEAGLFLLLSFIALSLANEKNEEQKKKSRIVIFAVFFGYLEFNLRKRNTLRILKFSSRFLKFSR